MRNWNEEITSRVEFIREILKSSGAKGIVFGNSGGKDSALVGILCKLATENVLGVMMPCQTKQNYTVDITDAKNLATKFAIKNIEVDLSKTRDTLVEAMGIKLNTQSLSNIAPRLRMTTLYAIALEHNYLVAGTGNRSENYVGYFTKFGDGAYDFNPIADLVVTEVLEVLDFLDAPKNITTKPPSGGLFEGQTDEAELGFTYAELDKYLLNKQGENDFIQKVEKKHKATEHKRRLPTVYKGN